MRAIRCLVLFLTLASMGGYGVICDAQTAPDGDAHAAVADEQGESAPAEPDGLGVELPPGFDKATIVTQLADDKNPDYTTLVGVVPWPQKPRHFLAIVCQAITDTQIKLRSVGGPPRQCDGQFPEVEVGDKDKQFESIFLGIYELGEDGKPVLIARSHDDYLDYDIYWSGSNIQVPQWLRTNVDKEGDRYATPPVVQRFDLAPYEIRKGDMAFGLRVGWVRFAGDTREDESGLVLFEQVGNDIRVIFSAPMAWSMESWKEPDDDGQRDSDSTGVSDVLIMLPTQTHGYRDIELRERNGRWRQKFTWSTAYKLYEPVHH